MAFLLIVIFVSTIVAQTKDKQKSLVFKNPSKIPLPLIRNPHDLTLKLLDEFELVREANSGDPVAEHELGLCYLTGDGFAADTQKAAYWIKKAADQDLPFARYNYGILLFNGLGMQWNPFEAYHHFQAAAKKEVPQAYYMLGILLSDNLAVPRNLDQAYRYFKTAADSGFAPAKEVLAEFDKHGWLGNIDSVTTELPDTFRSNTYTFVPADNSFGISDSATSDKGPDTSSSKILGTLSKEAIEYGMGSSSDSGREARRIVMSDTPSVSTTNSIRRAADLGSPEALTLMGRYYEKGIGVHHDIVGAAAHYLRAIRLGSPRAPVLLWVLIHDKKFFDELKARVNSDDPDAEFVWAGLVAIGFDNQLTEQQALKLLEQSAGHNNLEALVELGMCTLKGIWVKKDRQEALSFFEHAAELGNTEAKLRLMMLKSFTDHGVADSSNMVSFLVDASTNGSLLAEEMLGYCYERGFLVSSNVSTAVKFYRSAAQRGSTNGYNSLRRMYDEIRPSDKEFIMMD